METTGEELTQIPSDDEEGENGGEDACEGRSVAEDGGDVRREDAGDKRGEDARDEKANRFQDTFEAL